MWDFLAAEKKALQQAANHCRLAQVQGHQAYQQVEQTGKKVIASPVGLTVIFMLGMLKGLSANHSSNQSSDQTGKMPLTSLMSVIRTLF